MSCASSNFIAVVLLLFNILSIILIENMSDRAINVIFIYRASYCKATYNNNRAIIKAKQFSLICKEFRVNVEVQSKE